MPQAIQTEKRPLRSPADAAFYGGYNVGVPWSEEPTPTKVAAPTGPSTLYSTKVSPTGQTVAGTVAGTTTGITTAVPPERPRPELGAFPEFELPERDPERLRELTQEGMFPMRGLRRGLERALLRASQARTPQERKMLTEAALKEFGGGVSTTAGQARQYAQAAYAPEYAAQMQAAQLNWQGNIEQMKLDWGADMQSWFKEWETKTITEIDRKTTEVSAYTYETPEVGGRGEDYYKAPGRAPGSYFWRKR